MFGQHTQIPLSNLVFFMLGMLVVFVWSLSKPAIKTLFVDTAVSLISPVPQDQIISPD